MTRLVLAATLALAALIPAAFAQAPQKIDGAKSYIRFVTKQMNVPVEGQFKKFDGTVAFDPAKPEATKAEFEVELGSIDLGNAEGDTEAKRKLWLNIDAFPKAKFVASSVKQTAPGKYEAAGALTIKGITQNVVAPFTLKDAAGTRTVEGQFPLKRLQYKIGEAQWSDTDTVADEVLVRFRLTLPTK
jgi:polyisoprenoid-binding protein YceI